MYSIWSTLYDDFITTKRLVAKPGRFRIAEVNLDIFSTSADVTDVADHFWATFFYHAVGEKACVDGFITSMTRDSAHENVFHYSVKPESGHKASIEQRSNNGPFPVHCAVKVNSLK